MRTKALLTPFFLDKPDGGYDAYRPAAAAVNDGPLDDRATGLTRRLLPLYENIARFVADTAAAGAVPVTYNGDCVMAIPVLAGLQRAGIDPLLIWFDAHGDFNTWETTPSGFLGGMPLAMMVGLGEQTLVEGVGQIPLPMADVILTDARDLDPEEAELVAGSGIDHRQDVTALLGLELPDRPLWVHFDVDVLRLADVPAVSYPAQGGPSVDEMRRVFDHLRASGRLACLSISLPNPALDADGRSRANTLALVEALIG